MSLKEKNEGLTMKVDEIGAELSNQNNELEAIRSLPRSASTYVAFTAATNIDINYSNGAKFQFPIIITNRGAGWQPSFDVFLCPHNGNYMFVYSVMARQGSNSAGSVFKANERLVSAYADEDGNQRGSAANTVFTECTSGQNVYVQCVKSSCHSHGRVYEGGINYHTFGGVMLADLA